MRHVTLTKSGYKVCIESNIICNVALSKKKAGICYVHQLRYKLRKCNNTGENVLSEYGARKESA